MIQANQEQFNNLSSSNLVDLKCDQCGKLYQLKKHQCVCNMIRKGIRRFDLKTYCCKKCNNEAYIKHKPINKCQNCGAPTISKFCSKSCAAIVNNSISPKRIRKIRYCKRCNQPRQSVHRKFCDTCIEGGFHLSENGLIEEQTLEQSIGKYSNSNNRYNAVRGHARRLYKLPGSKCHICGYDKHVEVCHIKPINSFSLDTLVKEINKPENIILLCPNHHWELDHHLLKLVDPPGSCPGNLSVMSGLL